jgi:aldose 1-epimerase
MAENAKYSTGTERLIMGIEKMTFGSLPDGGSVEIYTLTNAGGIRARIMNYGGTLVSLEAPDRAGKMADVVLGFDGIEGYLKDSPYFGCITGRFANRIAHGRFTLDGVEYKLAKNNGENHLHGGLVGFDKKIWRVEAGEVKGEPTLKCTYTSPDGEEGSRQPRRDGGLYADGRKRVGHRVFGGDRQGHAGQPDQPHVLESGGRRNRRYLGHEMQIFASRYTPVDSGLIPTGEVRTLDASPWTSAPRPPSERALRRWKAVTTTTMCSTVRRVP